jgi:hypothetical protein
MSLNPGLVSENHEITNGGTRALLQSSMDHFAALVADLRAVRGAGATKRK